MKKEKELVVELKPLKIKEVEITIKRKYYGRYSDKEEAKKVRDKILLELGIEL